MQKPFTGAEYVDSMRRTMADDWQDARRNELARRMRRWSDAKLEKELAFATPANDGSRAATDWAAACQAESARRAIA